MTLKYELLRRLVRIINIKKMWSGMSTEALLENRRRQNAKNRIPDGLLPVLPLMCNSDFFGIGEIHGQLIRCGTCGNSDRCDYLVVGSKNKLAAEYETVTDEQGFLVSRRKEHKKASGS